MTRFKVPKEITRELDATGLPWTVETGRPGHGRILLAGHLVAAMSSMTSIPNRKMFLNVRATIRRTSREMGGK